MSNCILILYFLCTFIVIINNDFMNVMIIISPDIFLVILRIKVLHGESFLKL